MMRGQKKDKICRQKKKKKKVNDEAKKYKK